MPVHSRWREIFFDLLGVCVAGAGGRMSISHGTGGGVHFGR